MYGQFVQRSMENLFQRMHEKFVPKVRILKRMHEKFVLKDAQGF